MDTPSGDQEMRVINESGLYSLILGSRKPEAKKFKKWVTAEVLPAIRKTGRYTVPQAAPVYEQISANDHKNLQRVVWMIGHRFHWNSSWTFAVWYALRSPSGKSPVAPRPTVSRCGTCRSWPPSCAAS